MSTSLIEALRAGDLAAVERLAEGAAVHAADDDGMTPLMLAAQLGQGEAVACLLARGAAPDARDARGFTALYYACHNADEDRGHPEVVAQLAEAGADIEAAIGYGVRPLMYAAGHGEAGVVQALLAAGADAAARNEGGRTALMMVKDRDYVDVINILHEAEALGEGAGCGTRNAPDQQVITFRRPAPRG